MRRAIALEMLLNDESLRSGRQFGGGMVEFLIIGDAVDILEPVYHRPGRCLSPFYRIQSRQQSICIGSPYASPVKGGGAQPQLQMRRTGNKCEAAGLHDPEPHHADKGIGTALDHG